MLPPTSPSASNAPSTANAPSVPPTTAAPGAAARGLHPRNRHRGRYDFAQLVAACPQLAPYVRRNAYGDESIDFSDAQAVRALNAALLAQTYAIRDWRLPPQYLCPPIPGRADALHHLADLLASDNGGTVPRGRTVRVLDVGVGANGVYPLIGHAEYGWRFVGSDIDRTALAAAQAVLDANPDARAAIELRWQADARSAFRGVVRPGERYDLTLCNPPFHASIGQARRGSTRKWQNLGRSERLAGAGSAPHLNFGGQANELCCAGGETAFIARMIAQSAQFSRDVRWFSSLVAKAASLPAVHRALDAAGVLERRTLDMTHGQKKSRIVAWTYLSATQRRDWRQTRRGQA